MNQAAAEAWWAPERAVPDPGEVRAPAAEAPLRAPGAVPFWAVMTFTFILVISPQSFVPALGPLRIALLAAGAAIGTYVYQRFRRGEPLLSLRRGMGPAIALLAWSVLTIPFSVWPGGSLAFLLEVYAKTLAVFWLVSCTVNTLDRLRTVAWGLTLMTLPLAWTAVRDFFSGVYVLDGVHEKVR